MAIPCHLLANVYPQKAICLDHKLASERLTNPTFLARNSPTQKNVLFLTLRARRGPWRRAREMTDSIPAQMLDKFANFGELLRYLRRRAGLTQTELSIAVGYSDAQISRLEQNLRLPNLATVQARFLPVLRLKNETAASERLLQLAQQAQQERTDIQVTSESRSGR